MTEPIHFSNLKAFALSPAHYVARVERQFEPTRQMRVGSCVHEIVLGRSEAHPIRRFPGDRRAGKEWDRFLAEHPGVNIVTAPEWADAEPIAAAVLADPVASALLRGARFEVPLEWEDNGVKCATGGVDIVGADYLADLKTTSCTEPEAWKRHATKLLYPQQMAFYEKGAIANGLNVSRGLKLIGVETDPPYAVTVLSLTGRLIEQGRKSCAMWLDRYRACRDSQAWPAYTQSEVEFDVMPWMVEEDDE